MEGEPRRGGIGAVRGGDLAESCGGPARQCRAAAVGRRAGVAEGRRR